MIRQLKIEKSITSRSSMPFVCYLADISKEPMISTDDEIELAQAIHKGGTKSQVAKNRLVMANLRFVISVAKQYQHQGLPLEDLINEGNIGLIKAAERFDETRGFKFISYAVWWIRQSIKQAIAENRSSIRKPLNIIGLVNTIKNIIDNYEKQYGRHPSYQEIADIIGIDEKKVATAVQSDFIVSSIDATLGEENDTTLSDLIQSTEENTDANIEKESMLNDINRVLAFVLNEKERTIIVQQYGIGCKPRSLDEISDCMGLTRERVRQIRENSLSKIRKSNHLDILAKYLG